jgi:hypothetical protein
MKRALFLIATVAVVLMLSSCGDIIGAILVGGSFEFLNHSSYAVTICVDRRYESDVTFTLQPGKEHDVDARGVGHLGYTYTPSDLVETGARYNGDAITGYDFWNK